jgi:predicted NBD/HSP70 family sugar kinase/biotin operon repressor
VVEQRPATARRGAAGERGAVALRGVGLDNVRRNNLSSVLRLVHTSGSISRAQLTRELGLNRSTIAALVTELVERGLVVESAPEASNQVGRPSLVISPDPRVAVIAINPELDALTIALVGLGGRVINRVRYDHVTVPTAHEVINVARAIIASMTAPPTHVLGVGLAVPGLVRASDGMVRVAPHLGWRDEPVAAQLAGATGLDVVAANDATCGAIAEHVFGAGRGVDDMVYLNGGASGIGGGVIVGGVLLGGADGYAGEIGHTLVTSDGRLCHCGSRGCLETEVSRKPLLDAVGLTDAQAEQLDDVLAARFAADPDPALVALVEHQAAHLVIALRNVVNIFNTRRIVLGGFLGSLSRVRPDMFESITARSPIAGGGSGIEVVRAELGTSILMVGAAELAFATVLADPTAVGTAVRRAAGS